MSNIDVFKDYYNNIYTSLNKKINSFNKELCLNKNKILNDNLSIFANLNSGGKLIRGVLVNLGYKIKSNNESSYSDDLSLAYELFQTSILVHDDIIDNDILRRNNDTVHYANYKKYQKDCANLSEIDEVSKSIAICTGDYGLYLSNKVISDSYTNDKNLGKVLSYYNDIVLKTIEGELLDVILPFECKNNIFNTENLKDNIMLIYKLKTAYYTIVGPLCMGMILAGCKDYEIDEISKFGEKVGIAYQIQDDLLGIYSDNMGKVIGSDIREFKQTILYSYIESNSNEYKEELLKYYGKDKLDENVINNVREIFDKSGAKHYSINLMNSLYDEGIEMLNNIKWISEDNKNILRGFVEYLKERNK